MEKTIISTEKAPSAVGTYSQGVRFKDTFFFSGMLGLIPSTMELPKTFKEQTDQILKNIDGVLESQELTRENIIKTTIFLVDLKDFPVVNEAYQNYFSEPYPARSCVEVSRLPKDALVEIEVIAGK